MRVQVRFTIPEVEPAELAGTTAVVVDVLRATSTLVTALSRGAGAVFPAVSTEEAIRLSQSLGREDTLLCGERKGLRIEGYDLGNSPREFTSEVVRGKRLIMNTTNGTRAFLSLEGADRVLAASFLNLAAVVEAVQDADSVLVVCAGREDRFALEDAVCAGILVQRLADRGLTLEPGDGARAAMTLARTFRPDQAFLASTQAGQALVAAGLEGDLSWCAHMDVLDQVPVFRDRSIVLADPSEG